MEGRKGPLGAVEGRKGPLGAVEGRKAHWELWRVEKGIGSCGG